MPDFRKPGPPTVPGARHPMGSSPSSDGFHEDVSTAVTSGGFHRPSATGTGRVSAPPSVVEATSAIQPGFQDRAPRARVSVPVRYRYASIIDFVETQSVNVSRTGMFVASESPLPMGTLVQFEFALADGFVILKGTAEVVRAVPGSGKQPSGMGLRFQDLEDKSRKLIERIVEVNTEEGKAPTVPLADLLTAAETMSAAAASPGSPQSSPALSAEDEFGPSPSMAGFTMGGGGPMAGGGTMAGGHPGVGSAVRAGARPCRRRRWRCRRCAGPARA